MARLLLVEDDRALLRGLAAALRQAGYSVDCAETGEAALQMIADEPYALVTLDLGLPDLTGYDVLSRLRARQDKVPVLILSAREAVSDRIKGLDLGADDFMLKPFEPAELEARIRALLRRSSNEPSPIITIGTLSFDQTSASASVSGRELDLRRREWTVLERLVAHVGSVVSKDQLAAETFSYDDPVAPNAIEVYVARLRKKLGPDAPEIRTIWGVGYMLVND